MSVECEICKISYSSNDTISATACGHVCHHKYLLQWFNRYGFRWNFVFMHQICGYIFPVDRLHVRSAVNNEIKILRNFNSFLFLVW